MLGVDDGAVVLGAGDGRGVLGAGDGAVEGSSVGAFVSVVTFSMVALFVPLSLDGLNVAGSGGLAF